VRIFCAFNSISTIFRFIRFRFMVLNATFNNISVILWRSLLLVEETRVSGENHWPVVSHWKILSAHKVMFFLNIEFCILFLCLDVHRKCNISIFIQMKNFKSAQNELINEWW
jgi:hypothetical protein